LAEPGDLLGTRSGVDAEEVERLLLEFGGAGVDDELVSRIKRGGDGVSRECGEVGEKRLKAVHREAIRMPHCIQL
jgi:hypothetical protein